MRHLRPCIINTVRELSKWMSDGAAIDQKKVMKHAMNYVLHARDRGLHLNLAMSAIDPKKDAFKIKGRFDSDYATNVET